MSSRGKSSRRAKRGEAHVRVYKYELECPAYKTMKPDSRALLIEMRSLFSGKENKLFLSVREMQTRLGIGQRRAQQARDDLLERGWIRLLEPGSFSRKARHASVYALTSEPLSGDGPAPKDYMKWEPSEKSTVAVTATVGSRDSYREPLTTPERAPDGSQDSYREGPKSPYLGSQDSYTDRFTKAAPVSAGPLLWALSRPGLDEPSKWVLCMTAVALSSAPAFEVAA